MPKAIKEAKTKIEYETMSGNKTKKEVNSYLTGGHDDIVTMMEQEWPQMTEEFKRLQREQYELFLHKQHDYGPGNISVGTHLQTPCPAYAPQRGTKNPASRGASREHSTCAWQCLVAVETYQLSH